MSVVVSVQLADAIQGIKADVGELVKVDIYERDSLDAVTEAAYTFDSKEEAREFFAAAARACE